MNANPKFLATQAHVDEAAVQPFPGSRKVHLGPLRVPMREIVQTGDNPPILVYDTSGPYTDPAAKIDIRAGLPALREPWIERRDDTDVLEGPSSLYGRKRLEDPKLAELRFDLRRRPRRAVPGRRVTQMHYARTGIVTPEMEFIAERENQRLIDSLSSQHRGESFGAKLQKVITPEFVRNEVARGRAIIPATVNLPPPHRPPPGHGADDHRPHLPGEDQLQHRQFGGELVDRRGSRQDDVGDPLGRRHGHGSLHRKAHPRDPRVDHP